MQHVAAEQEKTMRRTETLISDQNPKFPVTINAEMADVLSSMGLSYEEVEGCYDGKTERSFMVKNLTFKEAVYLAKIFGQESVCHRDYADKWVLAFVNGDAANSYVEQKDMKITYSKPADNYTKIENVYLQIDFDFDHSQRFFERNQKSY